MHTYIYILVSHISILCKFCRECKSIKLIKLSFILVVARYSPSYEKATVTPIT